MSKIKVLALFGKSGAGKDTIQKWMVSKYDNCKGIVSCTTRPPRDYEIDGVDYYFLTPDKFAEKVLDGSMLEAASFNGWFYGTAISELSEDKINVGVFNIKGVERLLEDNRIEVLPVYVKSFDRTRLLRNLSREEWPNCEEICRRFLTDEQDFRAIDYDYETFLNEGNIDEVTGLDLVMEFIEQK